MLRYRSYYLLQSNMLMESHPLAAAALQKESSVMSRAPQRARAAVCGEWNFSLFRAAFGPSQALATAQARMPDQMYQLSDAVWKSYVSSG